MRAAPEKNTTPLLDVFSSMLKDTTSQHRAHLFDLNCKICTGEHNLGPETLEMRQDWAFSKVALVKVAVFQPSLDRVAFWCLCSLVPVSFD